MTRLRTLLLGLAALWFLASAAPTLDATGSHAVAACDGAHSMAVDPAALLGSDPDDGFDDALESAPSGGLNGLSWSRLDASFPSATDGVQTRAANVDRLRRQLGHRVVHTCVSGDDPDSASLL